MGSEPGVTPTSLQQPMLPGTDDQPWTPTSPSAPDHQAMPPPIPKQQCQASPPPNHMDAPTLQPMPPLLLELHISPCLPMSPLSGHNSSAPNNISPALFSLHLPMSLLLLGHSALPPPASPTQSMCPVSPPPPPTPSPQQWYLVISRCHRQKCRCKHCEVQNRV